MISLFVTAAMLSGADVHALESAVGFGFGLLAAVASLVEERVVHVLRDKCEDELRLGASGRDRQGPDGKDRAHEQFLHWVFLLYDLHCVRQ